MKNKLENNQIAFVLTQMILYGHYEMKKGCQKQPQLHFYYKSFVSKVLLVVNLFVRI